jgi:hypothetical protein
LGRFIDPSRNNATQFGTFARPEQPIAFAPPLPPVCCAILTQSRNKHDFGGMSTSACKARIGVVMQTLNYQFKQLYYRNRDGIYAIYAT